MEKETSSQHYEWHRERLLRAKNEKNKYSMNRADWNIREIESKHGREAAREAMKEFNSKALKKKRQYFT